MLLMLLVVTSPLYVQVSALNLRAAADAKSKLVATVPIGASCTELEAQGEWVKLECPTGEGFAKRELLAATAPDPAPLARTANDQGQPLDVRVQAGQRLIALGRKDLLGAYAFYEAFMQSEAKRLYQALKSPKPIRKVVFPFTSHTTDHQHVMRQTLMPGGGLVMSPNGEPSIAFTQLADNAYRALVFISDGKRADIYRDLVLPVSTPMLRIMGGTDSALCAAELVDRRSFSATYTPACTAPMSAVTAHSTCLLDCASTCSGCQLACPPGDGRAECTSACKAAIEACTGGCAKASREGARCPE